MKKWEQLLKEILSTVEGKKKLESLYLSEDELKEKIDYFINKFSFISLPYRETIKVHIRKDISQESFNLFAGTVVINSEITEAKIINAIDKRDSFQIQFERLPELIDNKYSQLEKEELLKNSDFLNVYNKFIKVIDEETAFDTSIANYENFVKGEIILRQIREDHPNMHKKIVEIRNRFSLRIRPSPIYKFMDITRFDEIYNLYEKEIINLFVEQSDPNLQIIIGQGICLWLIKCPLDFKEVAKS